MGLDIRWPIGLMFLLLGAVLAGYGVLSDADMYAKSLGINVNVIWGAVLAAFGLFMIVLARLGRKSKQNIADDRPATTR
jgi:ABC-type Fe3+-siderophore transport system permease subunit